MDERLPCTVAAGRRRQAILLLELAIAGSLVAVAMSSSASAASLYWDMNNNFPGATDDPSNKATGSWTRTLTNWSTDPDGLANTGPWTANSDAVFAAGNDATSSYDVTIPSTFAPYANSIRAEDATITLYGQYPNTATIYLTGSGGFDVASGKTAYISSRMRVGGSVGLTKTGPGTLTYTTGAPANTYSGPTRVLGGQMTVANDGNFGQAPATPSAGNIVLGGGARLHFGSTTTINPNRGISISAGGGTLSSNHGTTLTYAGIIADDPATPGQALSHDTYVNRVVLSGSNTFTGQLNHSSCLLTVSNSTGLGSTAGGTVVGSTASLQLEGNISIGAEPLTINGNGFVGNSNFAAQTGALVNLSGDNAFGGTITLGGSTNTVSSDSGTLSLTNAIATTSTSSKSLTLAGAGNGIVTGALGHSSSLTKSGTGTWTLQGNNTYTGTTTVNAGTLVVNGQLAATAGLTTITSGANLAGSGWLNDITVEGGGRIAPGGTAGTLSARNLTLSGTSNLLFALADESLISLTGNLTLDGVLNLSDTGLQEGTYRLIDYSGTLTNNGLQIGTVPQGMSYTISTATAKQVNLVVGLSVVPEPTGLGVLAILAGGLLRRRSRECNEGEPTQPEVLA